MASVVESVATTLQGSNSTSITATEPSGASEGDLLLAIHIADSGSSSPTGVPSGWSSTGEFGANTTVRIAWIFRGASAPDLTFTSSSSEEHVVHMARISGVDPLFPIFICGAENEFSDSIPNTPPGGTVVDGSLLFSAYGANNSTVADSVPSGYTSAGLAASSGNSGAVNAGLAWKSVTPCDLDDPGAWGTTTVSPLARFTFAINADQGATPSNTSSAKFESASEARTSQTLDIDVPKPSGTVEDDLLLHIHVTDNAETITPPTGFTTVIDEFLDTHTTLHVSWKIAGASEPSSYNSSSGSTENRIAIMQRFSNPDLVSASPIGTTGTATGAGVPSCPDVTTADDDSLVLRIYGGGDADGAYPGFTTGVHGIRNMVSVYSGAGACCGGVGVELQETAGATGAESWGSTSVNAIAATLAIKPGGAVGDDDVIADTIAVTDVLLVEIGSSIELILAEAEVGAADSVAASIDASRAVNDTAAATDSVAVDFTIGATLSDSVAVDDAIALAIDFEREISDVVLVTDQVTVETEFGRTASDVISAIDQIAREAAFEQTVSDAVSVVDDVEADKAIEATVSDAIAVADEVSRGVEYSRVANDLVAAIDSVQIVFGKVVEVAIDDTVEVVDQVIAEMEFGRSVADTVSVADAVAREAVFFRTVDDSIGVVDAVASDRSIVVVVSDDASVVDATDREAELVRNVSDSAVVVDDTSIDFTGDAVEGVASDAVAVTDEAGRSVDYSRAVGDVVGVVDQVASEITGLEVDASDSVEATDLIVVEIEFGRSVSDAMDAVDTIDAVKSFGAATSDAIEVTDVVAAELISIGADLIEVVDEILIEVDYSRTAVDAVEVEDATLTGGVELLVHSIDGGRSAGPTNIFTVSPDGPVTMSSGSKCDPKPTGFVMDLGDTVICSDVVKAGLTCEVVINDIIEVVG